MKITNIQVLPDYVANKIAAGEVVERPASVLKELIENALDAGSTQIDVEIVSGGRTLVQVSDNGTGMSRDDALLSIERHATSKIRDVKDIERIATMGFRGEALAAISSVSRFCLRTRRAEDLAGTEITMSAGKIQDVRDQGCAPGTQVAVRGLFLNVPARRKFLRSQQTELAHLRQVFMLYALSHSDVGMKLTVDGRTTLSLPGNATLEDRLRDLFPSPLAEALRPVDYSSGVITVTGYVSLPSNSRSDRSDQYIFINGRPARAPVLVYAIREGYHNLLPRDRHPIVFLFISLDPSLVDVNVHPTKKEVRFRNPAGVRDATIEAISRALAYGKGSGALQIKPEGQSAAHSDEESKRASAPALTPSLFPNIRTFGPSRSFPYPRMRVLPGGPSSVTPRQQRTEPVDSGREIRPAGSESDQAQPWSWMRVLGQVGELYVIMETEDGLVIMDPHAAHERVLFERFMADVKQGQVKSHGLLMAETVELSPKDALKLRQHMDLVKKMGVGIAEFGGDTFVVDAVPECLMNVSPRSLLMDLAACLEEAGQRAGTHRLMEERIAQAACKSAVKAMKSLTSEEIESLVVQLAETEMPYTCPHGRPTLIHFSWEELDKKFGRT